jgi:Glycosyltransferase family 92
MIATKNRNMVLRTFFVFFAITNVNVIMRLSGNATFDSANVKIENIYPQLHAEFLFSQKEWYDKELPVLVASIPNVKLGVIYSLFNTKHLKWDLDLRTELLQYRWICRCHSHGCGEGVSSRIQICPSGHTSLVECPLFNTTDVSVSFRDTTYNISNFLELYSVRENSNTQQFHLKNFSCAACTSVKGIDHLSLLKSWVIYHKILGVQCFWIYLDRTDDDVENVLRYISNLSFVQIIQYNFNFSNIPFHNQQAIQNECIYRSKAVGVKLLVLLDIDEFLKINIIPNRVETLENSIEALTKSIQNYHEIGGIRFQNWFHGRRKHENVSDIILEYTGKSRRHTVNERQKLIVLPENVKFFSVHTITDGSKMYEVSPKYEGYIAHFKRADEGVFNSKRILKELYFKRNFVPIIQNTLQLWDRK